MKSVKANQWLERKCSILYLLNGAAVGLFILSEFGRWHQLFDILNQFRPLIAVGAIVLAMLNFVVRDFRFLAAAVALLAIQLYHIAPELTQQPIQAHRGELRTNLRFVSFNAWEMNHSSEKLMRWLDTTDLDMVAIQEINPDLRTRVAALLVKRFPFFEVGEDNLIFSRFPLARAAHLPEQVDGLGHTIEQEILAVQVTIPHSAPITLASVHFAYPFRPHSQTLQLQRFPGRIRPLVHDRTIVLGDFNATPWSFGLARVDQALAPLTRITRALPTWPAPVPVFGIIWPLPLLPIDHVYIGKAMRLVTVVPGPPLGSDHYPVVVHVALD